MMTGATLTAWRQRHGLSITQLAALLGVQRQIVWRWERHGLVPSGPARLALELLQDEAVLKKALAAQQKDVDT